MAKKMMLIDTSKCIGCKACQVACQQWHQLPAEDTSFEGTYQNPPDMSAANLTVVKFIEVGNNGDLRWLFFVDRCRHCEIPLCKSACPRDAIKQKQNGIVYITNQCNPAKCSPDPVKPCQLACPFTTGALGLPRYKLNDGGTLPKGKANKCDFCYDRFGHTRLKDPTYKGEFAKSNRPACQVACTPGAIISGTRFDIRNKATDRVAELQANGYPQANVYPATYATRVIWVLTEPPAVYGLGPPL